MEGSDTDWMSISSPALFTTILLAVTIETLVSSVENDKDSVTITGPSYPSPASLFLKKGI